jgi:hypothetical protein
MPSSTADTASRSLKAKIVMSPQLDLSGAADRQDRFVDPNRAYTIRDDQGVLR